MTTGLMVQPPKEGDESFVQYKKEKEDILSSLKRRAELISNFLNTLEGVTCNSVDGALYACDKIF